MTGSNPDYWPYDTKNYTYSWHDNQESGYDFEKAKAFCDSQGGFMAMPKNYNQREEMLKRACGMTFWVGMKTSRFKDDNGEHRWIEGSWDDKKLAPEVRRAPEFFDGEPSGEECVSMANTPDLSYYEWLGDQMLFDTDCKVEKNPFLCQYEVSTTEAIGVDAQYANWTCEDEDYVCGPFSVHFPCKTAEMYNDTFHTAVPLLLLFAILANFLIILCNFKIFGRSKIVEVKIPQALERYKEEAKKELDRSERFHQNRRENFSGIVHGGEFTPTAPTPASASPTSSSIAEDDCNDEHSTGVYAVEVPVEGTFVDSPLERKHLNTNPLTGLRGMLVLHIVINRFFIDGYQVSLLGSVSVGFFYLLSGFILTVKYGQGMTAPEAERGVAEPLNTVEFLRRRFARIYPVYILSNFCGYHVNPYWFYPTRRLQIILTCLGLNMYVYPFFPILNEEERNYEVECVFLPLNRVSWTVQTMSIFYILFPFILPRLRHVDEKYRLGAIQFLYCLQVLICFATFVTSLLIGLPTVSDWNLWVLWVSRAFPFNRLPTFLMGCLSAVHVMHCKDRQKSYSCFGCCCIEDCVGGGTADWGRRGTKAAGVYLWMLFFTIMLSLMLGERVISIFEPLYDVSVPYLFLHLIISVMQADGAGLLSRVCNSRATRWLANISYSMYLFHGMISTIFFEWERIGEVDILSDSPVLVKVIAATLTTILVGAIITEMFEKPLRKCLRGPEKASAASVKPS